MAESALQATTTSPGATQAKNIILLSDGTGNSSASVWRTNVWRVFQSFDLTDSSQVAFYDDGVGTSSFKPLAVVGGAFGYGLKRNVLDLYTFLCRNYRKDVGDKIFAFGFSRGAYTIRVVTGLIATQGLVPYESEAQLRRHAKAAYRAYRRQIKLHTWTRIEDPFRLMRDSIIWLRDRVAERIRGWKPYSKVERIPCEWDLRLMSVAATKDLLDVGRNLIIVALVGADLHIRIFDASGKKVVDKAESELISGEILTALKKRLNPFPDESSLSKEDKQEIIRNATSIAGHTLLRIHFLGLWDTVAAYGMPIEELTIMISQWIWPLELPSWELSPCVERACHAIAIDDERTTFHPLIWTEKDEVPPPKRPNSADKVGRWVKDERISQIWFSGAHSNVGDGYPDDSLSYVPLSWMLGEAKCCGLKIKGNPPWGPEVHEPDAFKQARSARDKDGRLYDSRKGLGGYYRYGPRKIYDLCNIKRSWISDYEVEVKVPKIHCSVFERITNGGHGYAPFGLPAQYAVVTDDGEILDPSANPYESPAPDRAVKRGQSQEHVWDLVWHRRVNYFLTLGVSLVFALFPFYIQSTVTDVKPDMGTGSWAAFLSPAIQLLGLFLPKFLTEWVDAYAAYPHWFAGLAIGVVLLVLRGVGLGNQINDEMRALWSEPPQGSAPSSWEYWLRTRPWYPKLIGATKRHVVPFIFLVVLVYVGFVGISRALFTTGSSLGLICRGTQNDTLPSPSVGATVEATSPFMTSSLCWASGIRLDEGKTYLITVETTQPQSDRDIQTTPLDFGREKMTWPMMYGARLLRRHLDEPWFHLIARTSCFGLDEQPLALTIAPPKMKPIQHQARLKPIQHQAQLATQQS